ncbi:DUF2231 domain-containing protein [Sphingomonas sp. RB1R13]|uniref:DUF2231 domain-containing protein n=1 Tax=Sphingomonas sp. RB1R13 TaxID=3096159 RepID=UPI002FC6D171
MADYVEDQPIGEPYVETQRETRLEPHRSGIASGVHRFLGGFPTAFFTLALVTDYAYMQSGTLQYQYFSTWLIVAALVTGGFAVLAGIADWITGPKGRRGFGWHFGLTILALLLGLLNAFVHSRDGWVAVVPQGILLSLATVVVLYAGGFIGAMIDRRARTRETDASEYQA